MNNYSNSGVSTFSKSGRYTKKKGKKTGLSYAVVFFLVSILIALCMAAYVFHWVYTAVNYEYIFPNVYISNINVGGLTVDEAFEVLSYHLLDDAERNLTVVLSDRELVFPAGQALTASDLISAAQEAYNYGREGSSFDTARALNYSESSEYHMDLDMSLYIDRESILQTIKETAADINTPLTDTTYTVEDDKISIYIGTSKRYLDADDLYNTVINAFENNNFSYIDYSIDTVNPSSVDIERLYEQLCMEAVNATYDKSTGEITPEITGKYFDLESARQHLALADEGSEFIISLESIEPDITQASLDAMLFRDVLGSCFTTLSGSNNSRNTNVTLACEAVNGSIFLPGESFSFNGVVGERTTDKGYMSASVYVGGLTVQEPGGGVCQVSSTIYLACLKGNFEIVDRECHQFMVTYMDYGLDATVYWGYQDFIFKNNTDYPIRIDANVSGDQVNITIYGTKVDDTYVEMTYEVISTTEPEYVKETDSSKPLDYREVTQTAYTGYTVKTYRNVYSGDGTLISSNLEATSYYQKRNQITVVGTTEYDGAVSESSDLEDPSTETENEPIPVVDGNAEPSTKQSSSETTMYTDAATQQDTVGDGASTNSTDSDVSGDVEVVY